MRLKGRNGRDGGCDIVTHCDNVNHCDNCDVVTHGDNANHCDNCDVVTHCNNVNYCDIKLAETDWRHLNPSKRYNLMTTIKQL